ncbi:flagella basal body P-ring formation protein FlgA [Nocardioides sp. ChNu-153]|uniref:SAF domain-containing protein n=1 Tax=unclassified Nocardioides TaxID=2615069 RepID=UPI002406886E|nr:MULTISPECIES: SAF domain-containing protein [unclassified Nocardioides]MDF9715031.1 flagella basal body P-ring formation protein FlgA [Nocardioides sp. ChNu-99]MDN7122300.1 flagella basal body P-ring formation protein FlgA [Nocardioides sp. ChNu-153]
MPLATPPTTAARSRGATLTRGPRRVFARHRRALGAMLLGVAVLACVQAFAAPGRPTTQVVVAARPVAAGVSLTAADLTTVTLPVEAAPPSSPALDDLVGRATASPIGEGEAVTETRLSSATTFATGSGEVAVPVRLPDPAMAALLRVGDVVDLVATAAEDGTTTTVARNVRVSALPQPVDDPGGELVSGRLVVFAADPGDALDIARAGAQDFLTIAFRSSVAAR